MYEGTSCTLFAKYAIPQMIGLVFNSVYMIVDGVFIGNGPRSLSQAKVSTHSASLKESHTAAHTPKQGAFRMGAITTLGLFHTFRKPCVAKG